MVSGQVVVPTQPASAAIDTGTTLIGGPTADVDTFYQQIGGVPNPQTPGYYVYPCSPPPQVSFSFGGQNWSISPDDFLLSQVDERTCVGSIFAVDLDPINPTFEPNWIVGDTFLKNVYSIFRSSPPSVGFAQLSSLALSSSKNGPVPVPTTGANPPQVTAGTNAGYRNFGISCSQWLFSAMVLLGAYLV
jgi:cathepsin D